MVRSRQRLTKRGETPPDIMMTAVEEALEGHQSLRAVGRKYDIDHVTLNYTQSPGTAEVGLSVGYSKCRQIFTREEENMLEAYVRKAASLYYGLNPREIRCLAYEFAMQNNKTVPRNWKVDRLFKMKTFTIPTMVTSNLLTARTLKGKPEVNIVLPFIHSFTVTSLCFFCF
jgi:hypothetical protein